MSETHRNAEEDLAEINAKCKTCDGTGKISHPAAFGPSECYACFGTGGEHELHDRVVLEYWINRAQLLEGALLDIAANAEDSSSVDVKCQVADALGMSLGGLEETLEEEDDDCD